MALMEVTQAEPQVSTPPSSPSLLSSESDAESDSEDSQPDTNEASKIGEVTSPQSQQSSGVQPSGQPKSFPSPPSALSTPQAVSISSSPASHPTHWEMITRTETIFNDLKQICRSMSIIAPKSGDANEIQMVFEVGGMLVLGKMEIDANVFRWVTRNLSEQKLNGHRLKSPVSEDVKPEDTLPETARASKPEFKTEVYHPLTTAPITATEMVQNGPPMSAALPRTPPTSPGLAPVQQAFTLNDAQQFIEMIKAVTDMQIASTPAPKCTCSHTPPEVTTFPTNLSARASRLEFKSVHEVWDKEEYEYKIVELLTPLDEETEYDEYVFVVRARIDKKDEKTTGYIDVKSVELRDVLRSVLKDVNGICLRGEKPSVEQNLLYNYLPDLEAHRNNIDPALNQHTLQHLDLLLDFIKKAYASTTERLGTLLEKYEITYDLLWALFKPNTVVYTTCAGTGKSRCVKFDFGEERTQANGVEYFHMGCRYLDSDGNVFGEASTALGIEKFRGTQRINSLGVFPLQYHHSEEDTRAHLAKCGQKFLKFMDVQHYHYQGIAFYMKKNKLVKVFVDSNIMVDAAYFREANPNYARPSINEPDRVSPPDSRKRSSDSVRSNGLDPSDVKGDDLLICSPTVLGFSLGNKLWAEFAVDDIKEIEWHPEAFDHLQMPEKTKKAIRSLSKARMMRASTNSFDDFIVGKGQGFNMLLYGPPGSGKTFTAEALAELLQLPLYAVSAGELGTRAEELEERLPLIFQRAAKWNALLLLDEADVFLEQRADHDINRNALVCVFLRHLEYYQGILFLTTNRVKQIDDAIASRINFKIKYAELGPLQRREIWKSFLSKAATAEGEPVYSYEGLESLVQKQLNGREIKNLVSTAHALATEEEAPMTISHLEAAINAGENFECDFKGAGPREALNGYF